MKHLIKSTNNGVDTTFCGQQIPVSGTGIDSGDMDRLVAAGSVEVCLDCAKAKALEEGQ